MMRTYAATVAKDEFDAPREKMENLVEHLRSDEVNAMTHSEVENVIAAAGMELLRQLFQAHLDQRGDGGLGSAVIGPDGVRRHHKRESGRGLMSAFGEVGVHRKGYRSQELNSVFPLDAELNLPVELYS